MTYNCRSLLGETRLTELIKEIENINDWTVIGVAEVRRADEKCIDLGGENTFYHNAAEGGLGGTGFLINTGKGTEIVKLKSQTNRVAVAILKLGTSKWKIIQVYAPTADKPEEEIEDFYFHLQTAVDEDPCSNTVVMGDFNAKLGRNGEGEGIGKFGTGERNERGDRLQVFVESNGFCVLNTMYDRPEEQLWTWSSPDGQHRNQIDYIMSKNPERWTRVGIIGELDTGSDHRAVGGEVQEEKPKKGKFKKLPAKRLSSKDLIGLGFEETLRRKWLQIEGVMPPAQEINKTTELIAQTAQEISRASGKTEENCRSWPAEIKTLLKKRRKQVKEGKDRQTITEISRTIRERIKNWLMERKIKRLTQAIEEGSKTKWRGQGRNKIVALKDENGREMRSAGEIMARTKRFYEELYQGEGEARESEGEATTYTDEEPEILMEEVETAVKSMKEGKAAGRDGVTVEDVKAGGCFLWEKIRGQMNAAWRTGDVPLEWATAKLALIHKKGDRKDLANYRPISLLPTLYKMFSKIIAQRLRNNFEMMLSPTQAGFRKDYSTVDHIFSLKTLIQKAKIYRFDLHLMFIDFEKAFDSVLTSAIMASLRRRRVDPWTQQVLQFIYGNSCAYLSQEGEEVAVKMRRGVRQGDGLSPMIFNAVLQDMMDEIDWGERGLKINGRWLVHLEFADDVVLIGKSAKETEDLVGILNKECKRIGLKINRDKCQYMTSSGTGTVSIEGSVVQAEKSIKYLGHVLSIDGQNPEITRRCSAAWKALLSKKEMFKAGCGQELKTKLWQSTVLPVLTYGCETWTLNKETKSKLRTTVRSMQRYMLNVRRSDKKRNTWISQQTGIPDIMETISKRKWKWAGHLVRSQQGKWAQAIEEWCPVNLKRRRGRPPGQWDNEMRVSCGGACWRRVAHDRKEWRRMGEVTYLVYLNK